MSLQLTNVGIVNAQKEIIGAFISLLSMILSNN